MTPIFKGDGARSDAPHRAIINNVNSRISFFPSNTDLAKLKANIGVIKFMDIINNFVKL
jgi:hypothetical protein